MKYQFYLISYTIIFMLLSGCIKTYYYYIPKQQTVLNFKEKGDFNFTYSSGSKSCETVNLGYAVTNNIALNTQFHTMAENEGDRRRNENVLTNNEIILFKNYNNLIPALNVGYGTGKLYRYTNDFDLKMRTFYLQPSIGYSNNYFDVGVSCKLSNTYYHLKILNQTPTDNYDFQDVGSREFHFFEPAFTLGVGYKFIKLRIQTINIYQFNSSRMNFHDNNLYISLNLNYNINKLFKQK